MADDTMTAKPLGEFGRIRRFFAPLAGPGGLALKDDAALIDCAAGHRLVVTVDTMVEGVHYLPDDPPGLVAKKLLRVNLSDLAAMAARPLHYLLTTALPASLGDDWVARFAAGLAEDQQCFGVDLLGGDSVATRGPAVLSLTAVGEVATGAEIRRDGAQAGDRIWISGTIGDAYLGLKLLQGESVPLEPAEREPLIARFQLPEPRTRLGPRLVGVAHAMCDVSDGLIADLGHICDASGVAAVVELARVPLSAPASHLAAREPDLPARLATAGDDYELLFTAPPAATVAIERLAAELSLPITPVGTIEPGSGVRLLGPDARPVAIAAPGYRHF